MSLTTYSTVLTILRLIAIVVTAIIAADALVVALILTMRRRSRLAAWLLFVACGASALLGLGYIVVPVLAQALSARWGAAGLQWAFVILGIASLVPSLLFGIALLLFRGEGRRSS